MTTGIYQIRNIVNNKIYIGSSKNIKKRFYTHKGQLRLGISPHIVLQRAWLKYGESNFSFEILEECTLGVLLERELYFIQNNSKKLSYNIGTVGGGDNTSKHPQNKEIREKISQAGKRRYANMSPEKRKEIAEKIQGTGNPNYGNRWNEDQKNHLSQFQRHRYETNPALKTMLSEVTKKQWSAKSKEERKEFSDKCKIRSIGTRNPFFGKEHSHQTKVKISEKQKERFSTMTAEEKAKSIKNSRPVSVNGFLYPSISEAAKQSGIESRLLWHRLNSNLDKYKEYYYLN